MKKEKDKIVAIAAEDLKPSDTVVFLKRTWKERLFSLPWHPMVKEKAVRLKPIV